MNQKGQVALFVALIFQVLFVFFAMIVNVGLLVHHKINLQNSADLAAYYGAMKQAEMLNAIGHVNYQIRQSWKLLNFRYNLMGGAGDVSKNPYKPAYYPVIGGTEKFESEADEAVEHPTVFCIPFTPVKDIVNPNESYCQKASGHTIIPIPQAPVPAGGLGWSLFASFYTTMANTASVLKAKALKGCEDSMAINWLQLTKEIILYKMDLRNRKQLLISLANELSTSTPIDLDGGSIRQGVYNTLYKNLTFQNKEGLKDAEGKDFSFKYFNSIADGECGPVGPDAEPKWLSEVLVYPYYQLLDAKCGKDVKDKIDFSAAIFNGGETIPITANAKKVYGGPDSLGMDKLQELAQFAGEPSSADPKIKLHRTSLGFEKNPWCVIYTGVSVKATPKIPFSPLGDVTITARAYAKPFGGRIGPWYSKTWQAGSDTSDWGDIMTADKLMDRNLPIRVKVGQNLGSDLKLDDLNKQKRLSLNHSRFLGDPIGLKSKLTMGQFEKAVLTQKEIYLNWFNEAFTDNFDNPSNRGSGDILLYDVEKKEKPPLRNVEIAAISPDQFDIANYSIDPDFYNNYLSRLKERQKDFQFMLRGDLGSRAGADSPEEDKIFSVRNQIDINKDQSKSIIETASKLTYYVNQIGQVLTAWQQKTPDSYVLDTERFGKCEDDMVIKQNDTKEKFTTGSCKAGGRVGYSVKLVDGKFLREGNAELGGPGVFGTIKNGPPKDF